MAPRGIRTAFLDWDVLKSNFCVWQWNSFVFLTLPSKLWADSFMESRRARGPQRKVKELDQIHLQPTRCLQLPHIRKYYKALILLTHRPVTVIITALFHTWGINFNSLKDATFVFFCDIFTAISENINPKFSVLSKTISPATRTLQQLL